MIVFSRVSSLYTVTFFEDVHILIVVQYTLNSLNFTLNPKQEEGSHGPYNFSSAPGAEAVSEHEMFIRSGSVYLKKCHFSGKEARSGPFGWLPGVLGFGARLREIARFGGVPNTKRSKRGRFERKSFLGLDPLGSFRVHARAGRLSTGRRPKASAGSQKWPRPRPRDLDGVGA